MARVLTNNVGLAYAIESSIGVLPGSPLWKQLEPNDISAYGANIGTTPRRPISATRGRRKGTVTSLESNVEFDADITMDSFVDFAEGFVFAEFANVEFDLKSSSGTLPPPAVAGTNDFTIDAASALLAGKVTYTLNGAISLVYAQGYSNAANNGIHALDTDLATSNTTVQVASTLVTETPPTNASLQVCGVRTDDLTLTISGSTATLVSGGDIADWSTLGLLAGQYIHIGGRDTDGTVINAYDDGGTDNVYGYARITSISGSTLNLDKLDTNLGSGGPHSPETIDVLFGRFLRNVATTANIDDNRYLERSFQFEATFPDLGGAGTDEYEYAIGNFGNELALNFPLEDKATATFGFIGTNADDITPTRKTGAASATSPLRTTAINTSSNIVSLTTDVVSLASDVCFKSLTITLNNNVTREVCLGTLGASFVNTDLFEVNIEAQGLFTNKEMVNAVKNNTTVTFAAVIANDDGAIAFDVPSLTFGGGDREYPVGESVLINLTGEAFNDPVGTIPNVSLGISLFPAVPTAA